MIVIFVLIFLLIIFNISKKEHFINQNKISGMYFINLDRNPERREYMEKQFKNHKLNINRYIAFDKNLINQKYLQDMEEKKMIPSSYQVKKRKKEGSLACLISHTNLWKKIYNENLGDISLIFEDDCRILPNFNDKLKTALDNAPSDWDMIWLGYNNVKGDRVSNYYYRPYKGFRRGYNTQHHCYLVRRRAIPKIISILFPIPLKFLNKDSILRDNYDKFNAYFYKERLAVQDEESFPISERTGNKNG
jgi:GR25 family glycosyltransferase involved in LPS biosynthesis